jgi:hypothetical protein
MAMAMNRLIPAHLVDLTSPFSVDQVGMQAVAHRLAATVSPCKTWRKSGAGAAP